MSIKGSLRSWFRRSRNRATESIAWDDGDHPAVLGDRRDLMQALDRPWVLDIDASIKPLYG